MIKSSLEMTDLTGLCTPDESEQADHEQVTLCTDQATGLRAIIGIHDTSLGPALGGTRFYAYASERDALRDVLRLSRGMTHKAAAAGLNLGGGKAVIIGHPATLKTPELLRAYAHFVNAFNGRYTTAADVGTTSNDLDIVGEVTRHVVGRSRHVGGSGDSGFSTAYGVFCAMQSAAGFTWGDGGLSGRRVGVEGAGKVGSHLIDLLIEAGAEVVVADPHQPSLTGVKERHPQVTTIGSVAAADIDIYAPCAMGATLSLESIDSLRATLVCGAANNQLLTDQVDHELFGRGILWVPDFIANAGGLIQVGGELEGQTEAEVRARIESISTTVWEVLGRAEAADVSTGTAAQAVVTRRLDSVRAVRPTS